MSYSIFHQELSNCNLFWRYPVLELKGGLFPNDRLKDSELLLKGKIFGPESILVEGNTLYTGTHDGKIVEITDGKIIKEFVLGPKCNMETLENCFRPLGIRRLNAKELIVADSFQGLYTVDMKQMTYKKILEANMEIDGEPMRFADDLDILDEDTVLLSDASTRWNYNEVIKDFMEGVPSGRVLQVHIPTRKVTVVTKGLYFANGVQLFPDKKSLLVCETMGRRVHRVYLSGEKKGQREVFLENLPGIPDNVRLSDDGTFWIALAGVKHSATFDLEEFSKDHPLLRRLLLTFVPSSWLMDMHIKMKAKHTITIQVSQKGKILSSLQDTTASVIQSITQTTEADGFFYFGNFDGDYIGRLRK
uniref:Str_synth domain-containing protein n=1 Tax=Steinernema glaseri TaxID=37863 RepID=A0A1I7YK21_9BILA